MSGYGGTVRFDGTPPAQADALLLDPGFQVAAAAGVGADGSFTLAAPAGFAGGFVLVRLYDPVAGARLLPVAAPAPGGGDAAIEVAVSGADVVRLAGEVRLPDGVDHAGVSVHLTPRGLQGVPAEARLALLRTGVEPGIRGVFVSRPLTDPAFAFRVLPGTWDLRVERFIDQGLMAAPGPPNLRLADVRLSTGATVTAKFGGFEFDVEQDTDVLGTLVVAEN